MKRVILASAILHAALFGAASMVRAKSAPWSREHTLVEFELAPMAPPSRSALPASPAPTPPPVPAPPRIATTAAALAPFAPLPIDRSRGPREPSRSARVAPLAPVAPAPAASAATSAPNTTPAAEVAPPIVAAPRVDVGTLFTGARALAVATEAANAPPARGTEADRTARARAAAQPYFNELLASSNPMEPTNVHAYYGALARRMRETWRPGFYRTPNMVDALLAAPRRMANVVQRYRNRASSFALTGRPDDPARPVIPTDFEDRNGFATVTTSTIVEVEQGTDGRVISVRVVRSARVRDFDEAAVTAVRAAIPQQDPVPMPGGRRSRFAFDVVASRDAIVPIAGFTFNESNGFFEMHYPGALHVRTRVRPLGSRALDAPWPLPGTAAAAVSTP